MFYKYLECLAGVERNSPVDGIWRPHHQLLRGPHSGWLRGRLKNKSLTFSDSSYSKFYLGQISHGAFPFETLYLHYWLLEVVNVILDGWRGSAGISALGPRHSTLPCLSVWKMGVRALETISADWRWWYILCSEQEHRLLGKLFEEALLRCWEILTRLDQLKLTERLKTGSTQLAPTTTL